MMRTKSLLLSLFVLTTIACGGRSTLHVEQAIDGGGYSEAGAVDGKRDGVLGIDGSVSSDAAPDGVADLSSPDDTLADSGPGNDRPGDGGPRPDGSDVPILQTDASDSGRSEGGRSEVSTAGSDAGDAAAVALTSIEISPSSPITVNVGTTRTLTVTANYSNNTSKDVSSSATVTSANTAILTVSGTTLTGLGTTIATTTITVTYGTQTLTATVTVNGINPLVSISIDNVPTTSLAVGATATLAATGVFKDGTKQDISTDATWASSNTSVAAVGNTTATKGVVTGVAAGDFYVTATVGSIVGKSSSMTVSTKKLVSIAVTSDNGSTLQRGLTNQVFRATGTYDDNSTGDVTQSATWSSDNTAVLTVVASGDTAGYVTTVAPGTASVLATYSSISGKLAVTVTAAPLLRIVVSSVSGSSVIIVGSSATYQYKAMGYYADNSTVDLTSSVTWSSSDTSKLTMSNASGTSGQASPVAAGAVTIYAKSGTITGQLDVTVSAAALISITLKPTSISSLIVGLSSSFTATGLYGEGSDTSTQFSIDVTTAATWTVDDSTIATVGNTTSTAGQVTGVGKGTANVTATLSGIKATASVSVITATLLSITVSPSTASVRVGKTYPFTAKGTFDNGTEMDITSSVTWTSSNTSVATISNASGSIGVATGVASSSTAVTITATLSTISGTASLTVNEAQIVSISIQPATTQTITAGSTQSYTVNAVYENGTTSTIQTGVTWTSSNTAVATIAASAAGGGFPGGGTTGGATATGVAAGNTKITASYTSSAGTTFTDTQTLVVNAKATITAIRLTPSTATIAVGETQTYTAYEDDSNGNSTALTSGVTLTSNNGTVASVSSGGGAGFGGGGNTLSATGLAAGSSTITASYTSNGTTFTATSSLKVNAAVTVTGLYITPSTATIQVNGTQQFRAHATFSDGTDTDVTANSSLDWTLDKGTVASITTASAAGGRGAVFAAGGGGLTTGLAAGSTTITATYTPADGSVAQTATATLTVVQKTVQSLTVSPTTLTMLVNGTQTFVAQLNYTDGTYSTVTTSATWGTDNSSVVVMSTTAGGAGGGGVGAIVGGATATAVGTGTAHVSVTYTTDSATYSATATVTVTNPTILSLQVTPSLPTVYLSGTATQQFRATLIYNDATNTTKDVTTSVQWSSSQSTVAVIGSSGANAGQATGRVAGTTTIQAVYTDASGTTYTGSTTLTVTSRQLTSIEISPASATTHVGFTQSFTATGIYDNGNSSADITTSVTWVSSTPSVASISNPTGGGAARAVATGVTGGSTAITATLGSITSSPVTLTVGSGTLSSITVAAASASTTSVAAGSTLQLYATGVFSDNTTQDLTSAALTTWLSSSDSAATVSTVSGSKGLVTGGTAGASATIKANYNGTVGSEIITITSN